MISSETGQGIGFVNIGIIGRDKGTVADIDGNFTISFEERYDNDSVRFSMLGYKSKSFLVRTFRNDTSKQVILTPRPINLVEIKVVYHKPRKVRLGEPVESNDLRSGFAYNDLGSELGVEMHSRKRALLSKLNINVGVCTYDSVTYRMNIYRKEGPELYQNILSAPVYISFTKEDTGDVLTFDLMKYSIFVEGEILVTLELYKDLGEGKLLFKTQFFTGTTFHKKTSEGIWTKSAGAVGMYLDALIVN